MAELDMMDPLIMTPSQFIEAVKDALDEEVASQRFAVAHTKLFESVMPLSGIAQQAAELRKKEKFLKSQINTMKDELKIRKKIDFPPSLLDVFAGMISQEAAADSDSSEEFDGDDDDEYGGGDESEDEEAMKTRVAPSLLRTELLDSGVPSPVLSLDVDALEGNLNMERLVSEIVCVPYHGKPCFLFAVRPSEDGDVSAIVRLLMVLSSKHCNGHCASLPRFIGAADYQEHVLVALAHSGGQTLARVARAASDGDLKISPYLQVALGLDVARALSHLHSGGVVHGAIRPEVVTVTLHQPVSACLLFTGSPSRMGSPPRDVHALGLVLASLALGRVVTKDTLPSAADIRAAAHSTRRDLYPPFGAFCELIVQMTQEGDERMIPTAAEAVVWLQSILEGENLDESGGRLLESLSLGSVPAIYELQRDHSPLRRF